jgi:3-O-methylgallate 3,4-dioxygenase
MAQLAAAFASSHRVMLAAQREDWLRGFRTSDKRITYYDRQGQPLTFDQVLANAPSNAAEYVTDEKISGRFDDVQAAMARMRTEIQSANLDVLIIVGDDQYELFHDETMPAMAIYYGDTIRNATRKHYPPEQWYLRAQMQRLEEHEDRHYRCDGKLALHLIEGLIEHEFDITAVAKLVGEQHEGHAFSFIQRWYLNGTDLPIVPVFLNTYNPPNPPLPRRCVALGKAIRALIDAYPQEMRIGICASGGLSHFTVEEDLDRGILAALERKDLDYLANLDPRRLKAGSSEIRNWIVVAAAAHDLDITWQSYTPSYRTEALTGTGLGFVRWSRS